jgi:hypothetical protein
MSKFETYDSPKRVELVFVDDFITKLKAGDKGFETGYSVDPWGDVQYHFQWDNGSTLSLYRNKDTWRYIKEPQMPSMEAL